MCVSARTPATRPSRARRLGSRVPCRKWGGGRHGEPRKAAFSAQRAARIGGKRRAVGSHPQQPPSLTASPRGLNPVPPHHTVPHRLAPAPGGPVPAPPSGPSPSPAPSRAQGVPFPLPAQPGYTTLTPPAPTGTRRIVPPAPGPRCPGVRNKARGAAGPGAAAMLAGAANKGVRPEAPARGPAGRGRCAGVARTMSRGPPLPGYCRPSVRPTRAPRGACSPTTHRPHLPATEAAVRSPQAPPSRAELPPQPSQTAPPRPRSSTAAVAARPRPHGASALRPPTAPAAPPGPGPTGRTAQAPQAAGGAWRCSPGRGVGGARRNPAGPEGPRRDEAWRYSARIWAGGSELRGAGPRGVGSGSRAGPGAAFTCGRDCERGREAPGEFRKGAVFGARSSGSRAGPHQRRKLSLQGSFGFAQWEAWNEPSLSWDWSSTSSCGASQRMRPDTGSRVSVGWDVVPTAAPLPAAAAPRASAARCPPSWGLGQAGLCKT